MIEVEARLAPLQWNAEKRERFESVRAVLGSLLERPDLSENERVSVARACGELAGAWIEQLS